jgi:hypothetical protein
MGWGNEFPTVFGGFQEPPAKASENGDECVRIQMPGVWLSVGNRDRQVGLLCPHTQWRRSLTLVIATEREVELRWGQEMGSCLTCQMGQVFLMKRRRGWLVHPVGSIIYMFHRKATMQTTQSSCPGSPPDTEDGWEPILCRGEINFGGSGKKRGKVGAIHA